MKIPGLLTDTAIGVAYSWTFVRGDQNEETLTIVREVRPDEPAHLTVTTDGMTREMAFADLTAAVQFQATWNRFCSNPAGRSSPSRPSAEPGGIDGSSPGCSSGVDGGPTG